MSGTGLLCASKVVVPTLLVSHWPVFDDVAARLTVGALSRAEYGLPRAEALQAVIMEIRKDASLEAALPAAFWSFHVERLICWRLNQRRSVSTICHPTFNMGERSNGDHLRLG